MKPIKSLKLNYRIKRFVVDDPEYKASKLKSFEGNPLTEAMPKRIQTKEIFETVLYKPPYMEERDEEGELSMKDLDYDDKAQISILISDFSLPETDKWFAFYMNLYRIICDGYKSRSPLSAEGERNKITLAVNKNKDYETAIEILKEISICNTTSKTSLLSGPSGSGKTHRAEQVLSLIPNVIYHKKYRGKIVRFTQLPWVKIDCPAGGSEKGLCLYFFAMLDYLLNNKGKDRYYNDSAFRKSLDTLQLDMAIAVATHNIGLIVIDELQNLLECSTSFRVMRFLDTLVNVVGVPIFYIGTSDVYKLFCPEHLKCFRTVRRMITGFYTEIDHYHADDCFWKEMVIIYWMNLLCINEHEPGEDIFDLIYKKTQGVPAILEYLMTRINVYITDNNIDSVDCSLIEDIYQTQLVHLHDAVEALAAGDTRAYEDLYTISKLLRKKADDGNSNSNEIPAKQGVKSSDPSTAKFAKTEAQVRELDKTKEMGDLEDLLPE